MICDKYFHLYGEGKIIKLEEIEKPLSYTWTSVTEQLPERGQEVLVAGEAKYAWDASLEQFVDIAVFTGNSRPGFPPDVQRWSTTKDWFEGQETYNITHWQPLPEPPEEENQ